MPSPRLPNQTGLAQRAMAIVMAGGNGTRLGDLTRTECKPALTFGGQYRHIDFPLSNCVNSGIRRIALATQYKAHSLIQHVHQGWTTPRPDAGEFIEIWPAQQRCGNGWYAGTADAIYQNLDLIENRAPDFVLILAGDHVYKMDYGLMLRDHATSRADVTIGCVEVPQHEASSFGILETDAHGWVTRFDEKPTRLRAPESSGLALASMGIYVFDRAFLTRCLREDAADSTSRHDFGRDILPALVGEARVLAHLFREPGRECPGYWRDIGTIDSYWAASMELLEDTPRLDFRDRGWPIWTHQMQCPPPLFVGDGTALRSIVAAGCRIAGTVERCVISRGCSIGSGSTVESTVVLPDVTIGGDCRIRNAIIASGCTIPDGTELGGDAYEDTESCRCSTQGIAVITAEAVQRAQARSAPTKVAYLGRR